jgi:hypothetical protein
LRLAEGAVVSFIFRNEVLIDVVEESELKSNRTKLRESPVARLVVFTLELVPSLVVGFASSSVASSTAVSVVTSSALAGWMGKNKSQARKQRRNRFAIPRRFIVLQGQRIHR